MYWMQPRPARYDTVDHHPTKTARRTSMAVVDSGDE
jgi:hypothetical protein